MSDLQINAGKQSTAIVVDDEPLARSRLARLLGNEGIAVVAQAENGEQAIDVVGATPADILFIDIQMPMMDGLQAASVINEKFTHPPAIVFCTAYEEYAIEAFKTNAVAYLLKPVNSGELRSSIAGAKRLNRAQLASVVGVAQTADEATISVHVGGSLEKLSIDAFGSFRSLDKHVFGQMLDGPEVMVNYTLKELESVFLSDVLRVHRSVLVNRSLVYKLARTNSGVAMVVLTNDSEFLVSRRHLSEVKKCFK